MRLLNTESFELRDSTDPPPLYSVFSHAHGSNDIGFEDFRYPEILPLKAGFNRLWQACSRARDHGSKWLWADTVCIDRSSSAAVSDALNSLSRIYQECTFSIIYLEDLIPGEYADSNIEKQLANCAWFRNVWVLPQLVFPRNSFIYDRDWTEIGTKASLAPQISAITSIEQSVLINSAALGEYSIAKRISWASKLDASRPEDRTFALLGILGVHMPIVYGEGHKAFLRLQEEILRDTSDYSLFAWRPEVFQAYRGLLAYSPAEFEHFRKGPNGPFCIKGEVQSISAGVIIHAHFQAIGHDLILLLENTEGFTYAIRLSKSGRGFIRHCISSETDLGQYSWLKHPLRMETQINSQERDVHDVLHLRICVERELETSNSGHVIGIPHEPICSGHKPSPVDSVTTSSHRSTTPTSSHDGSIEGIREPGAPRLEVASENIVQGVGQIEDSHLPMTRAQTGSIGEVNMDPSHCLDCGKGNVTTEWVYDSSEFEESDIMDDGLSAQDSESDVDTDGISVTAAISMPRTLDADHPFVEAVPALVESLIERFRSQPYLKSSERSNMCLEPEGRKTDKLSCSESFVDVQQALDSGDSDTAVFHHMRGWDNTPACPFYIRDRQNHRTCLTRYRLRNMDDVREHLWAIHRQPLFCPVCGQTFSKTADCNGHIRSRTCNPQLLLPTFEGVTISQIQELARQDELPLSMENRWLAMWKTIFPREERPLSWFQTTDEELRVRALRKFWDLHRNRIVDSFLKTQVLQVHVLSDEAEAIEALQNTVLNRAIDKVLNSGDLVEPF